MCWCTGPGEPRGDTRRQARPGSRSGRRTGPGGRLRWWLAGAGTLAAGITVTLLAVLLPGSHETGSVPAAVAAVARYAQAVPSQNRASSPNPGRRTVPVEVGRPVTLTAGGQRIVVPTLRLDRALVGGGGAAPPCSPPQHAPGPSGPGRSLRARLASLGLVRLPV